MEMIIRNGLFTVSKSFTNFITGCISDVFVNYQSINLEKAVEKLDVTVCFLNIRFWFCLWSISMRISILAIVERLTSFVKFSAQL